MGSRGAQASDGKGKSSGMQQWAKLQPSAGVHPSHRRGETTCRESQRSRHLELAGCSPKEQPETHKTNSLTPSPGQMFKEIQLRVLIWGESRPPMCGVWKYPVAIKDTRRLIGSRKASNISLHICPRMCYTYPVEAFIYFLSLHLAFKLLLVLQDMFGSLLFKKMPCCIIYCICRLHCSPIVTFF